MLESTVLRFLREKADGMTSGAITFAEALHSAANSHNRTHNLTHSVAA